ncbi:hypothetical protein ACFC09_10335 [Streptomyces sp. NPDC056161]|uniref:hypothetical protein n=1 Tax=Streptomyces sp. NPDC056161 TaxID=3345732 RepID=UPI0035DD4CF5
MVTDLYRNLANVPVTGDQLTEGLAWASRREIDLARRAQNLGVGELSELEKIYHHASEMLLTNYTTSRDTYAATQTPADYQRMLKDGQAYVNAKREGQDALEQRLNSVSEQRRGYDPVREASNTASNSQASSSSSQQQQVSAYQGQQTGAHPAKKARR